MIKKRTIVELIANKRKAFQRMAAFCLRLSLLALFLFLIGSAQDFIRSTQVILLSIIRIASLIGVSAAFFALAALFFAVKKKGAQLRATISLVALNAVVSFLLLWAATALFIWL